MYLGIFNIFLKIITDFEIIEEKKINLQQIKTNQKIKKNAKNQNQFRHNDLILYQENWKTSG